MVERATIAPAEFDADQPTSALPGYRLSLFDRFALTGPGGGLAIPAARHQALLAYLALQPGAVVDREHLATLLWSDSNEANARHSLSQALLALRKRFHPHEPLTAERIAIRLASTAVDVHDFERLASLGEPDPTARAIALFGQGFLPGFHSGAPLFDEWAETERQRLWTLYRRAVELYAAMPAAPSDRVLEALARLSAREPFDESIHRLVLRTVAQRQGAPAALAAADTFRRALHRELETDPETETAALVADIRAIPRMATPRPLVPWPATSVRIGRADHGPKAPALFENVPPRDLNFTGRGSHLMAIHEALASNRPDPSPDPGPPTGPAARVSRVAVHGLGGIGKSTIVAEYAYRHASEHSGTWWAPAAQRTSLIESLAALAAALDPKLADEPDPAKAAVAALALLARRDRPFLLIYDDVPSPDTIAALMPPDSPGNRGVRLVITTRWPDWTGRAVELRLDVFDTAAAVDFLQRRTGRLDAPGAARLATALGLLPLALDHAGAYCRLSALGFDGYLARIDAAIAHAPRGVTYPASIAATFGLALEQATLHHQAAETLLTGLAYLAPERIPLGLVVEGLDPFDADGALAALFAVSLVDHDSTEAGVLLTLHPLVQSAMRHRIAGSGRAAETITRAAANLAARFPTTALTDPQVWELCARLLPHALAFREHATGLRQASGATDEALSQLLSSLARYLHIRSAYREAEQLFREAIAAASRAHGETGATTAARCNDLAMLLSTIGRYTEAEPLLRDVIAHGERLYGRTHIRVAERLNNLARLLCDTRRYDEAEPLLREAIAIADHSPDGEPSHPLTWRNNLGILLNETGRNEEGEAIYRQALAIGRTRLGHSHHEVARCMNNLGLLLRDVGRLPESEAMVRDGLVVCAQVLGEDHPICARGLENLAKTLAAMHRWPEALAAAQSALLVHEAKLGPGHFWTRDTAATVAKALRASERHAEAAALGTRFGL